MVNDPNRDALDAIATLRERGVDVRQCLSRPLYGVTRSGDVWRLVRLRAQGSKKTPYLSGGLCLDTRGYPQMQLRVAPKRVVITKIHRLVAEAWIGPRPQGLQINHIDGDKRNSIASNLEYVTASENKKHSYRIGTSVPNRGGKRAKITEDDAVEIRSLAATGSRRSELASKFGLTAASVGSIIRRVTW